MTRSMNKIVCFLLIGLFISQSMFSRDKLKPEEEYQKFKAKYAEEAAVYTCERNSPPVFAYSNVFIL